MIIAVEGRKYEGKTTLAFWLACKYRDLVNAYTIMIFDPKWSFRAEYLHACGKVRRVLFAETPEEFELKMETPADALAFRPRIDTRQESDELIAEEFSAFCDSVGLEDLLRNPTRRPVILLVDEAELVKNHPALCVAVRLAVKGKLYIILVCHGPRELSTTVRRNVDDFYLFRQDDPADLDYIRQRCGGTVADFVSKLPQHHFIHYESENRKALLWNNPERWRSDIDRSIETATCVA